MNVNMYEHPVTQENVEKLKSFGCEFVDPVEGRLACNYVGKGKLASPDAIVDAVIDYFKKEKDLEGKKVLVTAGPTREAIDPVRYLSNKSTGKMGYEICKMARDRGAHVTLVSGPTHLDKPDGVDYVGVDTAQEMYDEVMKKSEDADIIIKAAAVSDYRPESVFDRKMKKSEDDLSIKLVRNKDILKNLGMNKKHQILVGFAAETNNVLEYAKEKITTKNLDFIVANDITDKNAGFSGDTNVVTIIDKDFNCESYGMMSKYEVAGKIFDKIAKLI
jgi:phosphopantothenoylcysteine decarboxylase/phosphopantothenate--cysteine ligase